MATFDRYLLKNLFLAILGVLAVLVGLDALSALVDDLGDLSTTYGFAEALLYVAYTIPRRIEEFIPYATLIGSLIGLGRLAASSELIIIRTAGVSMRGVAWMAIKPALLVAFLGMAIGEYIAPVSEQIAISQRALAQRDDPNMAGRYGTWNRDGNTFLHVDAVQRGGLIFGVSLLEYNNEGALAAAISAERGTYRDTHWLLEDVDVTTISTNKVIREQATTWRWDSSITPNLLTLDTVQPESLPLMQLWSYASYLNEQGLLANDIELAFWKKMLQPLAAAGLVVLAMSFIFGPLRDGTMGARIFAGVLAGVVFRISQEFFGPMSLLMGLNGGIAAAMSIVVCWIVGLILLARKT